MEAAVDTKTRILDEAETLLQERGFNAFSYADISKQLGIKNAAVHYHFPSKSDLGLAIIRRYRGRFKNYTEHLDDKYSDNPIRLLDGYIAVPKSFLDKTKLGCPLANLEADFNVLPEAMRKETLLLSNETRRWLTHILESGREQGVFQFTGPAKEKSLLVFAALHGAMLMASVENRQIFFTTVQQIKRDLGTK